MKVIKMLKGNSELFQTSGKPRRMKTWANKKKTVHRQRVEKKQVYS